MKNFKMLLVFTCLFSSASGQKISVDGPKIILKGVPFDLQFKGQFKTSDKYTLTIGKQTISPTEKSSENIVFKKIKTLQGGTQIITLSNGSLPIFQFRKSSMPGWVSILPPLVAIILAFISRSVVPSLFAAIWFGVWSLNGFNIGKIISALLSSFHIYILNTVIDRDHAILTLFTLMLGGMVGIVYRNGGMHGIIKYLIKKADTPRRGQVAIWLFGLVVFFDDYSNTLIVGNTSRLLCDKLKISRQKLAYIVDSTSAPVATIAVITTWIGFQIGIIADALPTLPGLNESAYMLFIHSIPYSFYPFLAIAMVGVIVSTGKDFGPMYVAEKNARLEKQTKNDKKTIGKDSTLNEEELFVKNNIPERALNAIIPIVVLILSMFYFVFTSGEGDSLKDILGSSDTFGALMHSTLLSALVAAGLSIGQGILNLNETLNAWFSGVKFMLMGMLVLILAWALADVSKDLHTADYIVSSLGNSIPASALPSIVFLVAAATAFGTGSSWGVMAILMPLVIPLAWAVMNNHSIATPENYHILYSSIACVLTGAVWADHCSPISDTTILTSMASGCDLMDHVWTQMPYAISAGVAALLLGTIPASFGVPWWILLSLGVISQILVVHYFGNKTD